MSADLNQLLHYFIKLLPIPIYDFQSTQDTGIRISQASNGEAFGLHLVV